VKRDRINGLTVKVVDLFNSKIKFVGMAPEGTRKKQKIKSGFYQSL
jgi:hypothetical protein